MRKNRLGSERGFTLIEIMMTVAIVGVLAALAIVGVRRYLTAAKSGEARNHVGAVSRAAVAAFERELMESENVAEGTLSAQASHLLCGSAAPVPAAIPGAKKYQPKTTEGDDFQTGDDQTGWNCIRFRLSDPTYYQLLYTKEGSPAAPGNPAACSTDCYEAGALGDLNGDGQPGRFARTGHINTATGAIKTATQIWIVNEAE